MLIFADIKGAVSCLISNDIRIVMQQVGQVG